MLTQVFFREELIKEVVDFIQTRVLHLDKLAIGDILDRVGLGEVATGEETNIILRTPLTEDNVFALVVRTRVSQFQDTVGTPKEIGVDVQFVHEILLVEEGTRHLHDGVVEATVVELYLHVVETLELGRQLLLFTRLAGLRKPPSNLFTRRLNLIRYINTNLLAEFHALIQVAPHIQCLVVVEPLSRT